MAAAATATATATAAAVQISSSLRCYSSSRDASAFSAAKPATSACKFGTAFATGSPLIERPFYQRNSVYKSKSVSIRSEQSSKRGNVLDVWLGRLAMVGFASAISVEIATGKGLLDYRCFIWDLELPHCPSNFGNLDIYQCPQI